MCILVSCLLLRLYTHIVMYVVMKEEYKMWWVEQDMISSDKLNDLDLSTKLLDTLRNSLDLIMWRERAALHSTLWESAALHISYLTNKADSFTLKSEVPCIYKCNYICSYTLLCSVLNGVLFCRTYKLLSFHMCWQTIRPTDCLVQCKSNINLSFKFCVP